MLTEEWQATLGRVRDRASKTQPYAISGQVSRVSGLVMEASGLRLPLGAGVAVELPDGATIEGEVVGFHGDRLFVMPNSDVTGLTPGAAVRPLSPSGWGDDDGEMLHAKRLPVGQALLGRVVDAAGRPIDKGGPIHTTERRPLTARPFNPLERAPIEKPLDVGVRAINALLTVGRGQRLGLFAGSGVGKSMLLGMMARHTEADVIVVGLIGERGREVKEFIDHIIGSGRDRSVVVAAAADTSPLMRLQGAAYATTLAEAFRDQGKHVLLIMDSLTRYAMAQREIALAVGEPPATRGYPPSVFTRLPQLVERAGNGTCDSGSITAFYTVLAEGDDQQDPVADAARAILDGHIVLSRTLADQGHYPAIDLEQSISRAMPSLVDAAHLALLREFKDRYARYNRARDLLAIGAYVPGADPQLDNAINSHPAMARFLRQTLDERTDYASSLDEARHLFDTRGSS